MMSDSEVIMAGGFELASRNNAEIYRDGTFISVGNFPDDYNHGTSPCGARLDEDHAVVSGGESVAS